MSFQIASDKYEDAYARFLRDIRIAIQQTFEEEAKARSLTQADLARELDVAPSVISRRLSGVGNVTLRTISDLYVAMGRQPLACFASRDRSSAESQCGYETLSILPSVVDATFVLQTFNQVPAAIQCSMRSESIGQRDGVMLQNCPTATISEVRSPYRRPRLGAPRDLSISEQNFNAEAVGFVS